VEDLLVLARLDEPAGGRQVVDLVALAREVVASMRWPVPVRVDLSGASAGAGEGLGSDGGEVDVAVDPRAVRRAVANLVANAARHAAGEVVVRVTSEPGGAVLDVLDDGPGIPPADRERVFERFTRLDDARDRDAGGTGLGLSIARAAVERDRGSVRAEEPPGGRGALLRVRLPLASRAGQHGSTSANGTDTSPAPVRTR